MREKSSEKACSIYEKSSESTIIVQQKSLSIVKTFARLYVVCIMKDLIFLIVRII